MDVAFRVDASLAIGTGHVMRCLTLARALRAHGARCRFAMRLHPGHLVELVRSAGFDVLALPAPTADCADRLPASPLAPDYSEWLGADPATDAAQTRIQLYSQQADWLVVDHYAVDARWEGRMRSAAARVLVIDDLANRPHDCDLLLDHTLDRMPTDYAGLLPAGCSVLAGARFALLRPDFAATRPRSLAGREGRDVRRLLVSLGGVDRHDMTGKVLAALAGCGLPADTRVEVVMGLNAPWQDKVREQARMLPFAAAVHVGIDDMAALMADCDLAIGAAGTTAWERSCLGLPTIALVLADNQLEGARALERAGAAVVIDAGAGLAQDLAAALHALAQPGALARMARAAAALCDGRGAGIVAERMAHG